ncbi:DNA adenine methylase [Candidatus Ulvibacter alkanivorans]|uniref:DNA adenine methylase n=1 Tax=Candidatus Ulvibacter alkanivorans TaxID=2267620 RepID=UPI0021D0DA5E|nr:DNA adenine methylase [Candidatus Ulvibacter alkanivorans]
MPKTPITYYGGKLNMVKQILPLIPEHRVYVEPYFGGGAIFFAKPKSESEVINDLNDMVVNFFEIAKTRYLELKLKIEATLFSRATYSVALAIYRMPHLFTRLQQAWAFYVGTNMGFSCQIGSWGFDKYGKRVKAFRNKKIRFDSSIQNRLEGVQIEHLDALKVIGNRDGEDVFFYLDPPYPNSDQGHYSGFSQQDFENLLEVLSKIRGKFLLSSYPNEALDTHTKQFGWHTLVFDRAKSSVHAKYRNSTTRKIEVLTANYPFELKEE